MSELKFSSNREVRELKTVKPSKTYMVKINLAKPVNKGKLKDIVDAFTGRVINQRTPIRVSHRRADFIRQRQVLYMVLQDFDKKKSTAIFEITGESGIYIKELITGDSGRTEPSLTSELGVECEVEELDVMQIHDE